VDEAGEDTESEDELSSAGSYESGGEEPAGTMDDVWSFRIMASIKYAYTACSGSNLHAPKHYISTLPL